MIEEKTVIVLGSSNSYGNTRLVSENLGKKLSADIIDLNEYNISYFDYSHSNQDDDFLDLMESLIDKYDVFVFATPVYWYNMSAIMKTFFDRLSDLLKIKKDLGRQLRGKSMAAISCSGHDDQGDYFWKPFELTAEYLGMTYHGNIHTFVTDDVVSEISSSRIDELAERISLFNSSSN